MSKDAPKLCIDCKHYRYVPEPVRPWWDVSYRPPHIADVCLVEKSLVDGFPLPFPAKSRREDGIGICQTEARYFEAKS